MSKTATLSHATTSASAVALALNGEGLAPDWIELIPAGPVVRGRDGRQWTMRDPASIVAAFVANRADLPIDMEHAQFERAPRGDAAPAYGWIGEVAARNGAIWGRVAWTGKGKASIESREYRYISPVFSFNSSGEILALKGAGLVNRPNLDLPALNREASMNWTKLLAALGLPETATEDDAIAAVEKLRGNVEIAENRAKSPPSLEKFVPRADYDLALNRATKAETDLAAASKAQVEKEITGLVDEAIAAGKIAPAAKDFYLASCRAEGGVKLFQDFIAKAPVSEAVKSSGLDDKAAGADQSKLSADEIATCRALGVTEAEFSAARAV